MRQNQKLTKLLRGRTIASVDTSPGSVHVRFQDETDMAIDGRLRGDAPPDSLPGAVEVVRDAGQEMNIELASGTVLRFVLDDPGGSVVVRDADHTVRYAG